MNAGQDVLRDFERASRAQWRLMDGLGGWSAGTVSGAPTHRSHALLATASPHGELIARVLRFEEKLAVDGATHELSAGFLAGRTPREGAFAALESFTAAPWPTWRWRFGDTVIERVLRLLDGHAALIASWRLVAGGPVKLHVAPLLTARAPHALLRENPEFRGAAQGIPGRVRIETLPGQDGLTLWHNGAFLPARGWARGLTYPLELASEDDGTSPELLEDAFLAGWVQTALELPDAALHVVLSPEEGLFRALATESRLGTPPARTLHDCIAALERHAAESRANRRRATLTGADLTARQAMAARGGEGAAAARRAGALIDADDPVVVPCAARLFESLVRRGDRVSLAGRWPQGRERLADTLRAGAALVSLRAFGPARAIARGALDYLDEGLAPESFDPEGGAPRYGDPEPSLWLVNLVDLLARRSPTPPENDTFLREQAWPALAGVLDHLRAGSRHGVRCDRDGLLWSGEGEHACARASTNALWYHALVAMAQLGKLLDRRENAAFYLAWAHEVHRRFPEVFWDEATGALFDALGPEGPVRGLSPGQLYAASLPPVLLPAALARRVVETLGRELLGDRGLRARPNDDAGEPEWLGVWAGASLRSGGLEGGAREVLEARIDARLTRAAAETPLQPLAAAELLRAWIEESARSPRAVAVG